MTFPRRFLRLPVRRAGEWQVMVARTRRARLRGLAGLGALPARVALLLPACRSVHTFGMRFALDLVWLDAAGDVVRVDRDVGRFAVRSCRAARSVLEAPASEGEDLARAWAAARRRDDRDQDAGHDGERGQRPRRDGHRGDDDERDRGRRGERRRREAGVVVGQR